MNEPINFSFTPNKSDYIKTLRAFSFHQRSFRYFLIFMVLLSLCGISAAMLNTFTYGLIFPMVSIFYILAVFFSGPANTGNKVEKNERLRSETTWLVDENKISIKDKFAEIKFDWSAFGRAFETSEYILLSDAINKNCYRFVPKRGFQSEEQHNQFRKLLSEKVSPIVSIRSINLPELSSGTSKLVLYGILSVLIVIIVIQNFLANVGK